MALKLKIFLHALDDLKKFFLYNFFADDTLFRVEIFTLILWVIC